MFEMSPTLEIQGDLHPPERNISESSGVLDIPGQTTTKSIKPQHKGGSTVDDPKQVLSDISTMTYIN